MELREIPRYRLRVKQHLTVVAFVQERGVRGAARHFGITRLKRRGRRSRPREMKLFEKERPGDSIQVDVKVVRLGSAKGYQYTALDDCTRYRVLRLYPRCNQSSSQRFLHELRAALPLPDPQAPDRQRPRVLTRLLALRAGSWHSASLHPTSPATTERQGRTQPPRRQRGVLVQASLSLVR